MYATRASSSPHPQFSTRGRARGGGGLSLSGRSLLHAARCLYINFSETKNSNFPPHLWLCLSPREKTAARGHAKRGKGARGEQKRIHTHIYFINTFFLAQASDCTFLVLFSAPPFTHTSISRARVVIWHVAGERLPTLTVTTSQDVKLDQTFYPPKRAPAT